MNNILEWMWIFAITIIQTIHKYLDMGTLHSLSSTYLTYFTKSPTVL